MNEWTKIITNKVEWSKIDGLLPSENALKKLQKFSESISKSYTRNNNLKLNLWVVSYDPFAIKSCQLPLEICS